MRRNRSLCARIAVLAGSIGGLTRSAYAQEMIWKAFGDHAGQQFGFGIAGLRDLSGDGVPDILVGQPFDVGSSKGMARLLSGLDGSTLYSILGANSGDQFGGGVADLGDVDGDGASDFVVGAPGVDSAFTDQGVVQLYSGATGTMIYSVFGATSEFLGGNIAALGDVDGDGISDFVTGSGADYALVVSGASGAVIWKLKDPKTPSVFATSVGGGGDIDGDGVPDALVGDHFSSAGVTRGGAAWAFSGKTGAVLYEFDSTVQDADFGHSLTIPGDVDGDGFADVLIGAPKDSHVAPYGGSVSVYSGKDGSLLWSINAPPDGSISLLGSTVSGAGDANDDGLADFLVSNTPQSQVFLYSGRDGGILYHFQDVTALAAGFGTSLARIGDIDSDGHEDFLINATFEDQGSNGDIGSLSAWRGHDFFVDTSPRIAYYNTTVIATIGQCVAGNPYALFLLGMNGSPGFSLLNLGTLDVTGRAILTSTIPFGLGANTLELQAFTLDANNHLVASGVETFYTLLMNAWDR